MKFLNHYKAEVENSLEQFWQNYEAQNWDVPEREMIEAMKYAVQNGGKRVRPILSICVYDELKVEPQCGRDTALMIFNSIEFVHAFSLIHDDLPALDNDVIRRGNPSTWKQFGECMAILAGDALPTLALDNLINHSPENKLKALLHVLNQAIGMNGVLGGQVRDIYFDTHPVSYDALVKTHQGKTGALIKCSALWGGILAGISDADLETLSDYAENLGLLFQIKDDLLDLDGEESIVGKKLGKDVDQKGYVYLLGESETREKLKKLKAITVAQAEQLGSEKLAELVAFVCDRKS